MHIPPFDPSTGCAAVRETLEALPDLGLFRVVAHAQTAFGPWLALGGAVLATLELDPRLRELAILQVACQEGSDYEWSQHEVIAEHLGVPAVQIAALRRGDLTAAAFDETERLVLRAVAELGCPGGAGKDTVVALLAALGARAAVELVLVVGHYTTIARLIDSFAVSVDAPAELAVIDAAEARR